MQEVPDPNILQDPAMDAEPGEDDGNDIDDGGDDDYNDGEDYDTDGDYVDDVGDEAAAVLFGNRDTRRGRGRGGGRTRRGEEEEEDGEDLIENALNDYQPIAALDTYGREGIDDRDYGGMDADDRARADEVLDEKERERRRLARSQRGGRERRLLDTLFDEDGVDEDEEERRQRRGMFQGRGLDREDRMRGEGDEDMMMEEEEEEEEEDDDNFEEQEVVNLEAFDVPLREWIAQDRTRKEIQRKFRVFLSTFREGDEFNVSGTIQTGTSLER